MKTLILLRHAKSGWDDPVARDFDRPLNGKGERAAVAIGRYARSLGLSFDHVLASPAVRVVETLEHFAQGYGRNLDPVWDKRAYLASPETLLDLIRDLPDSAEQALVVAHNPGLEELVLALVPQDAESPLRDAVAEKFPTASLAVLTIGERWDEAGDAPAALVRFIRPRDLDASLGPDHA